MRKLLIKSNKKWYIFSFSGNNSKKREKEKDMNYKAWTIAILISIFLVSVGIGMYIYKLNKITDTKIQQMAVVSDEKITDECTEEAVLMANQIEEKVSPNAVLIFKKEHEGCGHTTKEYIEAPEACVNKTKDEIQKIYADWELVGFSNSEIVFKKTVPGICNEHYVLREEEDRIVVYSINENNQEKIFERTGILTKYLPETDRQNIKEGIFVNGTEELNVMLEDFE